MVTDGWRVWQSGFWSALVQDGRLTEAGLRVLFGDGRFCGHAVACTARVGFWPRHVVGLGAMGGHTIELPSSFALKQVRSVLSRVSFFPGTLEGDLSLSFHPKWQHLEPIGVAMLAAWHAYWKGQGANFHIRNAHTKSTAYAGRVGLLRHLGVRRRVSIAHEAAGRFMPLREVKDQADINHVVGEVASLVRSKELALTVQYAIAELMRNVLEHGQASAFVCAQYYAKSKVVSIAVADCGVGLRKSLQRHAFASDREALVGSMKPGVSGARHDLPYSAPDNGGLGLFTCRGFAKLSREYFAVVSGDSAYALRKGPKEAALPPLHPNPLSEETHEFVNLPTPWKGTVVAMNIRGTEFSHGEMLKSIFRLANDGGAATRGKIRFT
jgi:anti-sigma regulatory factor (Ser/Thr protein kinase)